ncbi:MAG: RnfABCDGE type electron transport complex subunit D [Brevinema sp.]
MPRRFLENAYLEAPFFRQSYATVFLAPTMLIMGIIILLGSLAVYGFGILIHVATLFLTALLLVPILKISQKGLFFKTTWWIGELFLLAAMLPVDMPWFGSAFAAIFYLLVARVFLSPNRRILFNPLALTFLLTILFFPHKMLYQSTVFSHMQALSLNEWLNASLILIQGAGRDSSTIFVGGLPGGTIFVVLFCGVILSLIHVISFSLAIIYTVLGIIILLVPLIKTQHIVFSQTDIIYIQNLFFAGIFLLREPTALEFSRKWMHVFLCAIITTIAFIFNAKAPWAYGVVFASIFLPLIEIYPERKIFGNKYLAKIPPLRPTIELKELAYFLIVSLCLIAIAFFFKEVL